MASKHCYPLTNAITNKPVPNKNTRFCPKSERVIGEPLTDYNEAKKLAISESKNVTLKLQYFKGESCEFTETYHNGQLISRIEKRKKEDDIRNN